VKPWPKARRETQRAQVRKLAVRIRDQAHLNQILMSEPARPKRLLLFEYLKPLLTFEATFPDAD